MKEEHRDAALSLLLVIERPRNVIGHRLSPSPLIAA
jgi:hypothetical protein